MSRVLAFALICIAAIVAATLVLDWFVVDLTNGTLGLDKITVDLREARACTIGGICGSAPMNAVQGGGLYLFLSIATFYLSFLFALVVAYQAAIQATAGIAHPTITRAGHGLGVLVFLCAVGAAYFVNPDLGRQDVMGMTVVASRDWGPLVMIAGILAGHASLHYTRDADFPEDPPIVAAMPVAIARTKTVTKPPVIVTAPLPRKIPSTPPPVVARTATITTPPPPGLVDRVQFATLAGELTIAGIDARREDRHSVLVLWRDVVGFVVRKLPPELESHTFLDIVSTAGQTLRVLPWTKLTGERVDAADPDARLRALVALVQPRCPEAKLDRLTQGFVDGKPAPQLPTLELLAKHDQAIA